MFGEGDDQEPENGVEEEEQDDDQELAIEAGEICGSCGDTFEEPQPKPALCKECWEKADEAGRSGYVESISDVITE